MAIELTTFDAAKYLAGDDEAQIELLTDALESGDRAYIGHAFGTVARARGGIAQLATATGLQRPTLHKALSADGNPTLETLLKVLTAFGFKAQVAKHQPEAEAA